MILSLIRGVFVLQNCVCDIDKVFNEAELPGERWGGGALPWTVPARIFAHQPAKILRL